MKIGQDMNDNDDFIAKATRTPLNRKVITVMLAQTIHLYYDQIGKELLKRSLEQRRKQMGTSTQTSNRLSKKVAQAVKDNTHNENDSGQYTGLIVAKELVCELGRIFYEQDNTFDVEAFWKACGI